MSNCGCGQQCGGSCQQYVQPTVQPVVAAQPRPSIAYSYGYPSTGKTMVLFKLSCLIMDNILFLTHSIVFIFLFLYCCTLLG